MSNIFRLIGPTGSGKSTAVQQIVHSYPPHSNQLFYLQQLTRIPRMCLANSIGLNLRDNLILIEEFLHTCGYSDLYSSILSNISLSERFLSGGETQLLKLSAMFVSSWRVSILDEPFSALDPTTRSHCEGFLKYYFSSRPTKSLLYISHFDSDKLLANLIPIHQFSHEKNRFLPKVK